MSDENGSDRQLNQPDLQPIRQMMVSRFGLEDLKNLCQDLGVDFDNLGGEGKEGKIRELLALLVRRDELSALMLARPGLPWPGGAGVEVDCPYKGLFAFREEDAANFFGREDVSEKLTEAVRRQALQAEALREVELDFGDVFGRIWRGTGRMRDLWNGRGRCRRRLRED